MPYTLIEARTEQEFTERAVSILRRHIEEAIKARGLAILGLSGGATPQPIYEALRYEKGITWEHVHIFLVDERYVPEKSEAHNGRMVREALLHHVPIHTENTFFPETKLPPTQCVAQYEQVLRELWSNHPPDDIVLGMGEDGHIASLFPPLPKNMESNPGLVVATTALAPPRARISLTLSSILKAQHHLLLLRGEGKRRTWDAMLKSRDGAERWPAKAVLEQGKVTILALW